MFSGPVGAMRLNRAGWDSWALHGATTGSQSPFHHPVTWPLTPRVCLQAALQTTRRQSAGDKIQRKLAEMLSMQGDERERVLGFNASEHRRISTAWDQSIHCEPADSIIVYCVLRS